MSAVAMVAQSHKRCLQLEFFLCLLIVIIVLVYLVRLYAFSHHFLFSPDAVSDHLTAY